MSKQELVSKDFWEQHADRYSSKERVSGAQFISTKGGEFHLGEEDLGEQMCVIICDAIFENTYYEGRYNAKELSPPRCYAFGREPENMVPGLVEVDGKERDLFLEMDPEEAWFEPQNETCDGCPHLEWGSSDTGRGKACQERRRLAVIPAGIYIWDKKEKDWVLELFDDPDDLASVDMAYLKVPVTSTKHWARYVKQLSAMGRPPFGAITRIFIEKTDNQFDIMFELVEEVPNALATTIRDRWQEAMSSIVTPYRVPEADSPKGVRGLKKKGVR